MLRSNILEIEESAFNGCQALEIFQIHKDLILHDGCFYACRALRKLDIVAKASGEVFFNCSNLHCVNFRDKCDLTDYIDIDSKIRNYSFYGNAKISSSLIRAVQNNKITITCFSDSNLCELAYNGVWINVEELPF